MKREIIPARIAQSIHSLRWQKVMLDFDLAQLYGVTTGNLNKAVNRNRNRFSSDFMFRLTAEEAERLIFQFGISKGRGGRRYSPYAFTEQGVAMLSSVLNSERAVKVNIAIMRAFVKLREALETNRELARKFSELEKRVGELACRRWRPRRREPPLPRAAAHGIRMRRNFSARRRKQHARRVCSPVQSP
jgi:ORF6N domain